MKQNRNFLPECVVPLLRSESLNGKCAKLLWQQATIEITRSLLASPLVSAISCSLASQALLEVTHKNSSIEITLLLLVRATYIWVLFFTHIPFVVNRTSNATPRDCNTTLGPVMLINRKSDISCKLDISRVTHVATPKGDKRCDLGSAVIL